MILIFDDNKYRLENLCKKLRLSDFYVKGESYEYCEYIKSICLFLGKKDKKQLDRLKDYSIMKGLIRILKNY